MSATATATSGPTTEQVMAFWQQCHNGIAVGTRRPTAYPEWVTLEVAEGGFATGRALALLGEGAVTSADFMANDGVATLEGMLDSGKYRVDQPENAALLVLVWLLRQGRVDDAGALFAEIAPYMDELRFYPHPTELPSTASSTVAAVTNVGVMRSALAEMKRSNAAKEASALSHRHNQARRQRAVAEGYAELQGDAVALLVATTGDQQAAFLALDGATDEGAAAAAALLFSSNGGDIGGESAFAEAVAAIEARAADLAQRFGAVPSHQRESTTTAMVLAALRDPAACDRPALARRLLAVAKARGVKGSDAFTAYLKRTATSAPLDQRVAEKVDAVLARVADLPAEATISSAAAVLAPLTAAEDTVAAASPRTAAVTPGIARIVRRATVGTLSDLITEGIIVSAEMIASVLPGMLAAAAGEAIEDPAAKTLYAQLSVSFAKRRSLLLVNLEKQVRLEELPWARPILGLLRTTASTEGEASSAAEEARRCDAVVAEAVRCYMTHFPATVTPNKVVSALKDVMRKGAVSAKANLMEELAADIFQNAFSPNFDAAALVASEAMRDTVYSRYYDLGPVYDSIAEEYPALQEEIRVLREKKAALIKARDESKEPRVDYHKQGQEEALKIFNDYKESSGGKIIYSKRHFAPLTPRGQKAKDDVYQCWARMYAKIEEEGKTPDYTNLSQQVQAMQREVCEAYFKETGKAVLHHEYMTTGYEHPPTTPREKAAEEAMDAVQHKYNMLATEQRNPGYMIQKEIDGKGLLIGLAKRMMATWQMPHNGGMYNSVQGGRTIEAAMVITTHNLAQCADMCGATSLAAVDFGASAVKAWDYIARTFVSPPKERRAILHARRDVAYAWRQILFFITKAGERATAEGGECVAAQRAVAAKMRASVEERARKVRPEAADKLIAHFIAPLEAVIEGAVHTIPEGAKITDGAVVLGYYGWHSFSNRKEKAEGEEDAEGEDADEEEDDEEDV